MFDSLKRYSDTFISRVCIGVKLYTLFCAMCEREYGRRGVWEKKCMQKYHFFAYSVDRLEILLLFRYSSLLESLPCLYAHTTRQQRIKDSCKHPQGSLFSSTRGASSVGLQPNRCLDFFWWVLLTLSCCAVWLSLTAYELQWVFLQVQSGSYFLNTFSVKYVKRRQLVIFGLSVELIHGFTCKQSNIWEDIAYKEVKYIF